MTDFALVLLQTAAADSWLTKQKLGEVGVPGLYIEFDTTFKYFLFNNKIFCMSFHCKY